MPADTVAALLVTEEIHAWDEGGAESAEALDKWVSARLAAHEEALAALLAVPGQRTLENTLRLYDAAIEQLSLAGSQAGVLNSVAADKGVRDAAQTAAQRVSQAGAALSLNRGVYDALAAMGRTGTSDATKHYVERTLLGYRLAGVDKDEATRMHLQQLHEQATKHSLDFSRNIQEGAKTIEAALEELDGLPADYLARHPANAEGKVTISTDQPDMQPVMTFAANGELRERMYLAYNTRAYPANKTILEDLLKTRQEIASVLGFRSWADLATADQMMGSAKNVRAFLHKLDEASREGAKREHEMILEFAREQQPKNEPRLDEIDITSRGYWYEQFRRAKFDFDSQSVRPYFPYEQVEAGVLATAARLFKVEFRASDATAWDKAVKVFDVFEGGKRIGRFYLDMHPREGKDKWFSAAPVVTGVKGRYLPEVSLICNFPGGEEGGSDQKDPGLMQYNDVVTYFHEFGHLMHAILGGHTEWAGLSGFATEGDFIEVPSQMLEEFFRDVKLLQSFAKHHETGEVLPAEIIQRMKAASAFGRADGMRQQIYYTAISLNLHDEDPAQIDLDKTIHSLYTSLLPWKWLDGSRMYASFGHLTGYSSNYYTYAFDKVIALDFFAQFDPENLLDGDAATRYRKAVLEQGGSKPGRTMVRDFLGRDEEFEAFQRWLGEEFEMGKFESKPALA
ncbi:M3 family metallopeptidase [Terracidiphilus gabretensis]|uniref:M3 family metallopeptidase n=1 Tax=Terracidiphilus gabretensis TaxID=1577687 RepID=UPI00071B97C2|nr:M3 family metallopeptidase [Terracidiphilus gabretensis]